MAYDKIRKYLKSNILIDDDTLLDYIHLRLNEENLNDYVSLINITNYGDSYYDPRDGVLTYNTEEIFLENCDNKIPDLTKLVKLKDKARFKLCNPNFGNIYNIHLINHEVNHLIQKKEILNRNNNLKCNLFALGKINEFMDDKFFKAFYYMKYHDRFYNEYNANIEAYYETILLFNAYNIANLKKDLITINRLISKHILYCYSDLDKLYKYSTPIKNALKINKHLLKTLKKYEIDYEIDKDILETIKKEQPKREIDKLLLGYSISKDTHNYLKNVSSGKIKTKNIFDDINY